MITALLVVAIVAALACPAHMVWHMRRRRRSGAADTEVQTLRVRHDAIVQALAERQGEPDRDQALTSGVAPS